MGVPPSAPRRRPRPGSPERPVNARMYRGTWLILAIPLLLSAFSVARPTPLPAPFPPAFDAGSAQNLAKEFAGFNPDRFPGGSGAAAASEWFREQLEPYGVTVTTQPFETEIAGYGHLEMQNLIAKVRGRSERRIVVLAHRDALAAGPGANDNASGTAALIVLARSFSTPSSSEDRRAGPAHTLVFVSTDGGTLGGAGAAHYAASETGEVDAVINLDAIAGADLPRLQIAGDRPRSPSWTLVRTASARLLEQTGAVPATPNAFRQLIDLAFPLSLYEQAPFVGRGVPAITITTDPDHPRPPETDAPAALEQPAPQRRIAQIGSAAQTLIGSVDQGLEVSRGGSPYLYFGSRVVRGWAVQLVLVAMLLPFLAAAVDLFARCRRRRIALAPAMRSYRSRFGFWLFVGLVFGLLAKLGAWPQGAALPISTETGAARAVPFGAIVLLLAFALLAWLVARDRLIPRRPVSLEEQLAGHTVALLILGLIALLVVAVNAFALVFVLPSLHAWLWLPQVHARPIWTRAAVWAAGFAGPLLLLWSLGTRLGLGLDAPAYLVELVAVGYVPLPLVVLFLGWLGVAGQLAALAAGRYAPYPEAAARPPRGPLRETVRLILIAVERRRASGAARRALEG
jgi:peptidase M28-like protein